MKTLALLALLAAPLAAAAPAAPRAYSDEQDHEKELQKAEKAIARGGGAEAYADRAAAKRALGRPFEDYIADYAEAAKRDKKYAEKYQGLLDQRESQTNPASAERKERVMAADHDANALAKVLGSVAIGFVIFLAVLVLFRGRENPLS